jgi:hypothetical protein
MRFQLRGFTSLLLTLAFLALSFSGVILYLTPRGRVANWTGWTMLGLEKQDWQAVHINTGVLFLIVAGLHLYLNWGLFWGYIKKKANLSLNLKLEMLVALLIAGGVWLGSTQRVFPFRTLMTLNEQIKDYWEQEPVTAPIPHAEELSIAQLAARMGLPLDQVLGALKQEGLVVESETMTITRLAESNRRTPAEVHAAIAKHLPQVGAAASGAGRGLGKGAGSPGRGPGRGMGRRTPE